MLEQLRQKSGSIVIWVLFGIIIAAFVLFFGPQSGPDMFGCGASSDFVMEVEDETVSADSWRFAMNGLGLFRDTNRSLSARRPEALDYLIERELLAQEAARQGFRISDGLVEETIARGIIYVMGRQIDGTGVYYEADEQTGDQPIFSVKALERFAMGLGLPSRKAFIEEQRRELMANFMRLAILTAPTVSDEELRTAYIFDNTRVSADYVKFDVSRYKRALTLSEKDLLRFADEQSAAMNEAWESQKASWSTDKERVRVRHIFIAKAPTDDSADPAPPPGEEGGVDQPADEGEEEDDGAAMSTVASPERQRIDEIKLRIGAGEPFADVAAEVSADKATAARGGLLGWRAADAIGLGQEVVDAVAKLDVGVVSEVIETDRGFHLIQIDERSDKGLTLEQVKVDLAAQLAADHYAERLAEAAANEALERAVETPLEELFQRRQAPTQLPEGIPPEILQQLQQQGAGFPGGDETGWIVRRGPIMLAQAGGATPATDEPPAGATPGAGGEAADKPAPRADETLPSVEVEPPPLAQVQSATRNNDFVAGVGRSAELVTGLFDTLEVGAIADKVYRVTEPEGFVIVKLTDRETADIEKFNESVEELRESRSLEKGLDQLVGWTRERCRTAAEGGAVRINRQYLPADDDGNPLTFNPCGHLSHASAYVQGVTQGLPVPPTFF